MLAEILHQHPLVEEILDAHRDHARGDERGYSGYQAHVYRVLNLARALVPESAEHDDKLAIAAAFHDLDAFSALDYLAPLIRAQDAWLERTGRQAWADELAVIVAEHHRFAP
jgi:HD superfamily phosphohydrolase YqeK